MELKNKKVFIIEKKTGIAHELHGVSQIDMPIVDVSDLEPIQTPEASMYSFTAKVKIMRRTRKRLRQMLQPRVLK